MTLFLWLVRESRYGCLATFTNYSKTTLTILVGVTLTDVVTAAIASYFGAENLMPLSERVSQLEKRLAALEGKG